MKPLFKLSLRTLAVVGFTALSVSPAWAVFPFSWLTDGSGSITGGSWTGNGTVQPNVITGTSTTTVKGPVQIAVQDFSSGVFGIDGLDGTIYAPNVAGATVDLRVLTNPVNVTHTINLTGGTADLRLHNSNPYDGGANLFNSVGLTGFSGVTSVSWKVKYDNPIAGRTFDINNLALAAMGGGLAMITTGTGQSLSSFTVGLNLSQVYQENVSNTGFDAGVSGTAAARLSTGFNAAAAGATSFTSNAFTGLDQFLLVRGYDVDSNGWAASDTDEVYIREMTWTITRDDNAAFAADTLFVFSMDGAQYSNYVGVIPEPTNLMLLAGSVVGGCLLRRRRA